jgi:tetratricopeptide (TPR) repeat protein
MMRLLAAIFLAIGLTATGVANAADAPKVGVRYGEHEKFSRIVFDWPSAVPYVASLDKGELTLDFKAAGALDFASFKADPPTAIRLGDVMQTGDEVTVAFNIAKPAKLRHFRDGPRVVVDVLFDADPVASAPLPPAVPAEPVQTRPLDAQPTESTRQATTAAQPAPVALQSAATIPNDAPALKVAVAPSDLGMRMTFPWSTSAGAAVFQRAGQLWIVFDVPAKVDLSDVKAKLDDRFADETQIPNQIATVLRFTTRKLQFPEVRRSGNTWTVDLEKVATAPATPLDVREQVTEGGYARLFLPINDPGLKLDVTDPVVGDKLIVVTVLGSGFGIEPVRNYAELRLLGTPQGVAIEPRADWIEVKHEPNGIQIVGARALAHSSSAPGDKKSVAAMEAPVAPPQLVDFEAWSRGPDDNYWQNLDKLLYDLSVAPDDGRNAARWNLAKFYLAHHQTADALGVLGLMAQSDSRMEEDPQFRAVRGIAEIDMERYGDALKDLSYSRLDADPHAALWRAVAESALGQNEAAMDHYHQGLDVISQYREDDRARFQLAAARAALGLGDVKTMSSELSILEVVRLPKSMTAETQYLKGRMYEFEDDPTSALDAYAKAIKVDYRPVTAEAEFHQIEVEAKQGALKPKEEIDRLDALRFKWRGGPLEFEVLHRLGQRYVEKGDYRNGLQILRQAVSYFPESDETRAITREMNQIFRDLFLSSSADKMPPVAALALYYDFRELTPIGADGDEMIRKLSDRLVKVDLLDRAEELLEHQVNYRLKGAAQAQIAARLARVYLLDRKPEKALKIIEDTRQVLLPPSIAHMRLMLEAKALMDMKKYGEAEGTMEGIDGQDADLIRGDIYWASNDWNKVATNAATIMSEREDKNAALQPIERQTVMRWAVALALQNDKAGLVALQKSYGKLMHGSPAANAFDVVTTTVDPTGINLRDLAGQIASVNTIEKLFDDYSDTQTPAS